MPKKKSTVLLEPEATLVVAPVVRHPDDIAMEIESGTIGVDYTPPPKAENEDDNDTSGIYTGVFVGSVKEILTGSTI